jgi:hypothetical protein
MSEPAKTLLERDTSPAEYPTRSPSKRSLRGLDIVFAIFFLKEKLAWNYLVAFAYLGVAAFFAFAFKAAGSAI